MILLCMVAISNPAAEYRRAYGHRLMVLAKLKSSTPECNEFCRIRSVETMSAGLWLSATFLDGSIQRFSPETIRPATLEEELIVKSIQCPTTASEKEAEQG